MQDVKRRLAVYDVSPVQDHVDGLEAITLDLVKCNGKLALFVVQAHDHASDAQILFCRCLARFHIVRANFIDKEAIQGAHPGKCG